MHLLIFANHVIRIIVVFYFWSLLQGKLRILIYIVLFMIELEDFEVL